MYYTDIIVQTFVQFLHNFGCTNFKVFLVLFGFGGGQVKHTGCPTYLAYSKTESGHTANGSSFLFSHQPFLFSDWTEPADWS